MNVPSNVSVLAHREPSQGWAEFDMALLQRQRAATFTLTFPIVNRHVLLGLKKRGFGKGLFNGFGGKLEDGETVEEAAVRELREECGLTTGIHSLVPRGQIAIVRPEDKAPPTLARLVVFTCKEWKGAPIECEEMQPSWFVSDQLPFDNMWPEARLYLPLILDDNHHSAQEIIGTFQYARSNDRTLDGWWVGTSALVNPLGNTPSSCHSIHHQS